MVSGEIKIRVSYKDTDRMGIVYHGNYLTYLEMGRVELLRNLGLSYKDIEDQQKVGMPVLGVQISYLKPIYFDELITVKTTLKNLPSARISFDYEVRNQSSVLAVSARVNLSFISLESFRPVRPPQGLLNILKAYFIS